MEVNKAIYNILKNDSAIIALVTGVFPVVAPEGTQVPAVIWQSDLTAVQYDKGAAVVDISTVTFDFFAKTYVEVVNIAAAIRSAFENTTGVYNTVKVSSSRVSNGSEGYDPESDTYFQKLVFTIKTSKA